MKMGISLGCFENSHQLANTLKILEIGGVFWTGDADPAELLRRGES